MRPPARPRTRRSPSAGEPSGGPQTRRVLARATLSMEALVVLFATLVAKDLSGLGVGTVLATGVALAVACLLVAGTLRSRWGYLAGSLLQVVLVLAGLVVAAMWLLGPIFAALWVAALHFGAKAERIASARPSGANLRSGEGTPPPAQ